MRPTIMQVNLENFKFNINSIKSYIGNNVKIMPVIKANAYGTFINTRPDIINMFDIVSVAISGEGEKIRKNGFKKEIFVLNQPDIDEIDTIIENDLIIGISENSFVESLGNKKSKVKVHIEIDTGMSRTGINPNEIEEYIENIQKFNNIEIQGIYTHLSSADIDVKYTKNQLKSFEKAVKIAKEKITNLKYIHAAASNGIVNFKEAHYNLVRPGIIMYGYESGKGVLDKINLKPVTKLKSKITFLKNVEKGISIGYSRSFITPKKMKIATIPIGYADGLRRELSNKGEVLINGKKAPIIGKVCMDSFMADVTEVDNPQIGDDVWIWDNENILLEDVAKKCGTINYEIMSEISGRVIREFV